MKLSNLSEAFLLKLQFNLKSEASKNYLNYLWWLFEPALHVIVFYFVFGVLLRRGGEGFVIFLLCGQIPFLWFSRSISNASNSILNGRGLIQQMAIPKPFFPLLVVAQDLVKQTVVFVCLLFFVLAMGYEVTVYWLVIPLLVVAQLLLISACSLFVAAVTPFVPDFRFIIATGMMMLMFASGIFYDYQEVLLEEHKRFFLYNPMALLIDSYRDALIRQAWPDFSGIAWIIIGSFAAVWAMFKFYRRYGAVYARLVIQ